MPCGLEAGNEFKTSEKSEAVELSLNDWFCHETRKTKEQHGGYSASHSPFRVALNSTANKKFVPIIYKRVIVYRKLLI
jgi:hypothetical protein